MIWFIMGIFILAVLLYTAQPLYAKRAPNVEPDSEVVDYLKQIKILDKQIENADHSSDIPALELAKTELQRQVLRKSKSAKDLGPRSLLLSSLFIAFAFGALGIYTTIGRPELTKAGALQEPVLSPAQAMTQNADPDHENAMSLKDAVAGLEAKLKQNDQDPQGWILYARSLMSLRRFDDAVGAYEKVLLLTNNNLKVIEEFESAKAYISQQQSRTISPKNPTVNQTVDKGPDAEQIKAAAAMTPEERQAMIKSMVDGLAAKLAENPNDPEGWVKLLNARRVMGQEAAAKADITLMQETFKDSPATIKKIMAAAGW